MMTRLLARLCLFSLAGWAGAIPTGAQEQQPAWHGAPPEEYVVLRAETPPVFSTPWDRYWNSPPWSRAKTLPIDRFHDKKERTTPVTQAKLLHDRDGLHVFFRVEDRHVRSVATEYQGPVYRDACVEFFFEPDTARGYINIEINAGGTLLMKYHDPALLPGAEEFPPGYRLVLPPWEDGRQIRIHHSLPRVIDPEIAGPIVWYVQYFIPFDLIEKYVGSVRPLSGKRWRANLYKISLDNSHPHRATWAPIPEEARAAGFHQPKYFAFIRFE